MQVLPFDPKLGEAIPLPSNFTVESQTADEIIIIGQVPDTDTVRKCHHRITFYIDRSTHGSWIARKCLKQMKREVYNSWRNPPEWRKSGQGGKRDSSQVIKSLLQGDFS